MATMRQCVKYNPKSDTFTRIKMQGKNQKIEKFRHHKAMGVWTHSSKTIGSQGRESISRIINTMSESVFNQKKKEELLAKQQ